MDFSLDNESPVIRTEAKREPRSEERSALRPEPRPEQRRNDRPEPPDPKTGATRGPDRKRAPLNLRRPRPVPSRPTLLRSRRTQRKRRPGRRLSSCPPSLRCPPPARPRSKPGTCSRACLPE
jgi:hypothetical protein